MYFCENSPNPCVAGVAQEGFFSVTRAPFTAIPATHGQHWHLLNTVGQPFFSFVFLVLKSILETANGSQFDDIGSSSHILPTLSCTQHHGRHILYAHMQLGRFWPFVESVSTV